MSLGRRFEKFDFTHLQQRGHFICQLPTFQEESICAVSGRLINVTIKFLAQAQTCASHGKRTFVAKIPNEYVLRKFSSFSLIENDEYWHHVATKCFILSKQLGLRLSFSLSRRTRIGLTALLLSETVDLCLTQQ
jgi:hypothetical protein